MDKRYYTYITSNKYRTVFYTGMTNDLVARTVRHKSGAGSKFTSKYRVKDLVYYEMHARPKEAIAREKEIKGWRREKKLSLIKSMNPNIEDLAAQLDEK